MAIAGVDKTKFEEVLRQYVRPSSPIDTFEHLVGRTQQRDSIEEAINSPGKHIFIYGDRGAGKTSLAQTVAFEHNPATTAPVLVACGRQTTFQSIIADIAHQLVGRRRLASEEQSKSSGLQFYGLSGSSATKSNERPLSPSDLNAATGLLQECASGERHIVVIDEFENLPTDEDRHLFAELVKQLSDRRVPLTLVFCGIGRSLNDLLLGHASSHRYLHEVPLPTPPLNFGGCWQIIDAAAEALGLEVNDDSRLRIAQVSDGFPHYVHLLCEKLLWTAFRTDETVRVLAPEHYMLAVRGALEGVEARLRSAYELAVKKDVDQYEEVLWAVADHYELDRNIGSIYANSYVRIMQDRGRAPIDQTTFTSRIASLRQNGHGSILSASRRGWVKFTENLLRGYVRLRAESVGVRLALEHEPAPAPKTLTVGRGRVGIDPAFPRRSYPSWGKGR
jgi:uncharacterized protein